MTESPLTPYEQGFGDTLQFCRYAPMVQAMGAKVFLYVREPIAKLLRQSFAKHNIEVIADNEPLPPFDVHCPMMSLPLALGTDSADKIPASIPYIFAKKKMSCTGKIGSQAIRHMALKATKSQNESA